ncbi:MAG: guanylate kinase [Flavobacteriales bacterium]|nr:guanylate kinase [Bacteroidota bacterium]MCB9240721.1 guanylate kinase [Flavobacteriales bacterium]
MSGKLIIFSAPSGSGKTTVVRHLLSVNPKLAFSVSATTRAKRPNEVHGVDYYFLSEEEFRQRLANDEFLEHEEVYQGLFYGTLKSEVERIWKEGKTVIFDVDVVGGLNIKKYYGNQALAIFLRPPSVSALMDRLKGRETEVEHQLQERISKAETELGFEKEFDIVLINNILAHTLTEAESIVTYFLSI